MRNWVMVERSKTGGRLVLGERPDVVSDQAVISITLGAGFSLWQLIINGIASHVIMKQCAQMPGLLYGEVMSDLKAGYSLTLTVWEGREMPAFRDRRAHGWVMRALWWVFYGGKAEAWFLTYKDGRVPSLEEAKHLVETYGRHFKEGKKVRAQRQPDAAAECSAS